MKRTATNNDSVAACNRVALHSIKSAPYRMGGYRRPVYRPDTRFGLTETGRAQADAYASSLRR